MQRISQLPRFPSPPERRERTVRVYLPEHYEREPERRFPVLYLQDGQNVFDHPACEIPHPWCVDRALEALWARDAIAPWIVVAVDHGGRERLADYAPWDEPRAGVVASGERYAAFVLEHLVPWVDRTFRTHARPDARAVGGSSMGGLLALHLALAHPETFGRVLALSPTVGWGERELFRRWRAHTGRFSKIYVDAGAQERMDAGGWTLDYGRDARDFAAHLRALGYGEHELRAVLEPGGEHDELAWRRRLPDALAWALG